MPTRPTEFHPEKAPPGVELSYVTFWRDRPLMPAKPRLQLVHTNGASREGSIESSKNWAHAKPNSNTCPHYQVDRTRDGRARAAKLLPTNRRGIGNATVTEHEGSHGDVSWWSIVIETADTGYLADPNISAFDAGQAEMVAQILAYESILHGIPLSYPSAWHSAGTACHTEPFTYPYWTLFNGKICPGSKKKAQMRDLILPRAVVIAAEWTGTPTRRRTLKVANRPQGADVKVVQRRVGASVDGDYGPRTGEKVKAFKGFMMRQERPNTTWGAGAWAVHDWLNSQS